MDDGDVPWFPDAGLVRSLARREQQPAVVRLVDGEEAVAGVSCDRIPIGYLRIRERPGEHSGAARRERVPATKSVDDAPGRQDPAPKERIADGLSGRDDIGGNASAARGRHSSSTRWTRATSAPGHERTSWIRSRKSSWRNIRPLGKKLKALLSYPDTRPSNTSSLGAQGRPEGPSSSIRRTNGMQRLRCLPPASKHVRRIGPTLRHRL